MGFIKKHISMDSKMKIISDGWAAHSKLVAAGYTHSIVIHKEEFKNKAGDTTNSIVSVWSQLKILVARIYGLDKHHLEEYISEFSFRYNFFGTSTGNCTNQFL